MSPAGYSGTPLVKKLGIKPESTLGLLGAPAGFLDELVGLPETVRVSRRAVGSFDLLMWFVMSAGDLETRAAKVITLVTTGLWIAWPKRASGLKTDVSEHLVRATGLAHGLVDYKVCAINDTWSGLKFARRQ